MATKTGNPDQFLQKVGGTYYARVRVPRTLEKAVGQSHIRKSLRTGDRPEANRLKHAVVANLKAHLERLRTAPDSANERGISFADAKAYREELKALEAAGDSEEVDAVESRAVEKAEAIEELYGYDKAKKWYRAATVTTDTLAELMTHYLDANDYRASTNHGHRKALDDVLVYLNSPDAHPGDVTKKTAVLYIDKELTQRGLAHATISDRLVSLGGFWKWMVGRGVVPDGVNPWSGHSVSKAKNKGTRPEKRAYTDDEILALLRGTDRVKAWATYAYIPDLVILGLWTGCRVEELCNLKVMNIVMQESQCIIHVTDAKTKAGLRPVAVTHPTPLAVIKRRITADGDRLFPELKTGGLDAKYSASVVKAYGRYRRGCGVPDGTDYHSFRRVVITKLEHAGVGDREIARFVGHKIGTLAGDTYSAGASEKIAIKTARAIKYSREIEAEAASLVAR